MVARQGNRVACRRRAGGAAHCRCLGGPSPQLVRWQNRSHVSAVSACETDRGFSGTEDFWIIVAIRSEDETEIRAGKSTGGADRQRHPACDAPAFFGRREDPRRARGTARRGEHRRALPPPGIASSMYYGWSKEFLEAGKKRLAGDTARAATSDEVKHLRREGQGVEEVVADLTLENRLLKKSIAGGGGDEA